MTDTITEPDASASASDPSDSDAGTDRENGPGRGTGAPSDPAGLVRISVRAGDTRVDLAVPGVTPVADLLPDLAAETRVLDLATLHTGYRLVRGDGAPLYPDEGLSAQGIVDGDVLLIAVGADDEPPRVYDDVVEAVADTVQRAWRPWDAAAARWTALIAAAALLGVGAVALGLARDEGVPVYVGGAAAAVLLLAAGAALARARGEDEVGTATVWLAAPYAAAAGLAVTPDEPVLRLPLAIAGGAVCAVGIIGMLVLSRTRFALLPPLALGAAAAAIGGVGAGMDDADPGIAAAVVLVVGVVVGLALPAFAASSTGLRPPNPQSNQDLLDDPEPMDNDDVEKRIRIGRQMLLALGVTVALLVVLSTPMVVDLGVAGAALAGVAAAALMLRTRNFRTFGEVVAGVAGGIGGLLALVISASVLHPDWRPALAGIGAAAGVLVLLSALRTGRPPLRLGRLADAAENGAVIALLPLLAVAAGLTEAVRR